MQEREQKPLFIPLFDALPENLSQHHDSIVTTFDGTIKEYGVEIILSPTRGEIIRANLYSLQNGKAKSYEPLARGRWCSIVKDLDKQDYEYQKLDRILEEVKWQFDEWKKNGSHYPIREWSNARIKSTIKGANNVIMPWEWFEKYIAKSAKSKSIEEIQLDLEVDALALNGQEIPERKIEIQPESKKQTTGSKRNTSDDIGKKLLEDKEFRSRFIKENPPQRGR